MSKKAEKADRTEKADFVPGEVVTEKSHSPTESAGSVVDKVFDAAFAKAAQALVAAKKGLEARARWLDGRAKLVGELAKKLENEQAKA
jgi:hypothetical protein